MTRCAKPTETVAGLAKQADFDDVCATDVQPRIFTATTV